MSKPTKYLHSLVSDPAGVLFLDIETTGLSRYYDEVTLVGYELGGVYRVHVAGDDPDHLFHALAKATTIVTFNGTLFDLPFLRKTFDSIRFPEIHIDLRYAVRRVGLSGGQKTVERLLGINVRDDVQNVDGFGAVLLWHQYLRGDRNALRTLIRYNLADVRGMAAVLDHVIAKSELPRDLFLEQPLFYERFSRMEGWGRPTARLPSATRLNKQAPNFQTLFSATPAETAVVVGIDLTGSEARPSGYCVLRGSEAETRMVHTDAELLELIQVAKPVLVSIDSPLSLPRGRTRVTDDDPGRSEFGIMRVCERILKRRGINVYPCLLPSMQKLTQRGISLAARLRQEGIPTIESYPGAAQDIMQIPRKGAGLPLLTEGLSSFGISGTFANQPVKHDELDAITSAVVGSFFLAGKYEALGAPEEGALIIPDLVAKHCKVLVGVSGLIAAGKTEVGRFLERNGYSYARFSQVIDDLIIADGGVPDRESRQRVGWKVHEDHGQRWLCEKVLARVAGAEKIVIDGLRFPDDFAYLFEQFGSRFIHVHVRARAELRRERLNALGFTDSEFYKAEDSATETRISELATLAKVIIENESTLGSLFEHVSRALSLSIQPGIPV